MAALVVALFVAAALAVPALRHLRETPSPAPPETRLEFVTPTTDDPTSFALSADGRQMVFVASGDGAPRLWLRSLDTTTARPLAGTEGATRPFWSPDGRSVGFFATSALKRLDLGSGGPQTLVPVIAPQGGTWNTDGVIVFAPTLSGGLMRIDAAAAAAPAAVTTLAPGQQAHVAPVFLPDGHRFLFEIISGGEEGGGIFLGGLDGRTPVLLTPDLSTATYLPPSTSAGVEAARDRGWLLWVRGHALVAQQLDLDRTALVGDSVTLVSEGMSTDGYGWTGIAAATGLIGYRTGTNTPRQLTWVDRLGIVLGTVGDPDVNSLTNPRVAPDGRRMVVSRRVDVNTDVWMLDGTRTTRLTFDPARDQFPIWSADGSRVIYRSRRAGGGALYRKLASGAGDEELLLAAPQNLTPMDESRDGRFLVYSWADPRTITDLWTMSMTGDRSPSVLLATPFRETYGEFSPDGRWVAYQSNESGRIEIYVRPFVAPTAETPPVAASRQWQVSTAGGLYPVWRPDGKELYYINPAGAMMAVPITITGAVPNPGAPVELFRKRIYGGGMDIQDGRQYDVAPDGRFLINTLLDSAAAPVTLIQHWNPDAKK